MMYIVRDAEGTVAFDIFFLACVILGSFVILNLMIAVQSAYLDKAFDDEEARQQEIRAKIERKKKLGQHLQENLMDDEQESEYDPEEDS